MMLPADRKLVGAAVGRLDAEGLAAPLKAEAQHVENLAVPMLMQLVADKGVRARTRLAAPFLGYRPAPRCARQMRQVPDVLARAALDDFGSEVRRLINHRHRVAKGNH